jgi:hypothetical protein
MSETVSLPPAGDARWQAVASGKVTRDWSSLAMKIMMKRIQRDVGLDPSPENVRKCAVAIHAFFQKNARVAAEDLAAVLR